MKKLLAAIFLSFSAQVVAAQEAEDDGFSLMEQGARMFLQGIMTEMQPALDNMQKLADELEPALREIIDDMGPAFVELFGMIDDLSYYAPPVFLPNGDIILRRLPDAPEWVPPEGAEIDI